MTVLSILHIGVCVNATCGSLLYENVCRKPEDFIQNLLNPQPGILNVEVFEVFYMKGLIREVVYV